MVPLFQAGFPSKLSQFPIGMEQLMQAYGYVLYTTTVHQNHETNAHFKIDGVMQDRALVYVNGQLTCVLGWSEEGAPMSCHLPMNVSSGTVISILVENKGRVDEEITNFDWWRKGIYGNVTIRSETLSPWNITSLPLESQPLTSLPFHTFITSSQVPTFYRGTLIVNGTEPLQTFLQTPNWGHGCVFMNGFNLGRFSLLGPQCSLYIPASVLVVGKNDVIVFESDSPPGQSRGVREMISSDQQMWFNSDGICVVQDPD